MTEPGKLHGRTAIVTGGGGAIGGAIARIFGREGANVVCADLKGEAAEAVAAEIVAAGGQAIGAQVDVSLPADAARVAKLAADRFGNIRILVNVAAAGKSVV